MARSTSQRLVELYLSNLDLAGEGMPAAINRLRGGWAEQLRLTGLPGKKDERYHLFDVDALYGGDWEYYFTPPAGTAPETVCGGEVAPGAAQITILRGFVQGTGVDLGDGAWCGSLREAGGSPVAGHYGTVAGDALAGLNGMFAQDCAVVYLPAGTAPDRPVVVDCIYPDGEPTACFPRILVVVEQGAKAEIVVAHRCAKGAECLVNAVTEIVMAQGAEVALSEISCVGVGSTLLSGTWVRQQGGSELSAVAVSPGEGCVRTSLRSDLLGEGASLRFDGLYLAGADERKAFDVKVEHRAAGCHSDQSIKGIVSADGIGSFTGRVLVAKGAQQTVAMQNSRNIQLSPSAKIFTRPQLEIYADDVKCSHGATVGQLDDQEVYYMRQRGIDLPTARRMQLEGFVGDVTAHIGVGRAMIEAIVAERLEKL